MMESIRRGCAPVVLGGLLLASLSGCQRLGSKHAVKRIPQYGCVDPNQPRELQMVSMPEYVVEPPDVIDISIRPTIDELASGSATVQSDGNIDLGFLGQVYVAGLTLSQVEQKIGLFLASQPEKTKLKSVPEVSVRLMNGGASKYYYVLGTVSGQGKYPCTGNDTVLDAMLLAGLQRNSLPEKAYLVRPHPAGGQDQILKIDWFGIKDRGDTLTNYQIFPGDRLVVPGDTPPGLLRVLLGG